MCKHVYFTWRHTTLTSLERNLKVKKVKRKLKVYQHLHRLKESWGKVESLPTFTQVLKVENKVKTKFEKN